MTKEKKQEFTRKITQANRSEIIVLLYEIALTYLRDAKSEMEQKEWVSYKQSIRKIQNCISELMNSLNFEYDISYQLMQLYTYVNREAIKANIRRKREHLDHIEHVLVPLLGSFKEVSKQDNSQPVMENAQSVIAGLTYGKNTLNESLQDLGVSRGFRV
ncbi:MAG: flagellar protein FliS [Lachnospiraceae bacterium]|nr:flagellar protein FliS [Lachnospiraceae bacterium]